MRVWLSSLLVVCLLAAGLSSGVAAAGGEIRLDEARRAALMALPALRGEPLTAEDLEGRVTVVTFFASWCPPCVPEFRHLKELKERHRDALAVVAVNIFEDFGGRQDPARMEAFLARTEAPFTLLAEGEAVKGHFGDVARIPTALIFAPDGRLTLHFIHETGATKMFTTLEELELGVATALAPPS